MMFDFDLRPLILFAYIGMATVVIGIPVGIVAALIWCWNHVRII